MQLDIDFITALRREFIPWVRISELVGCSTRTLERWRLRIQYQDPLVENINEEELDALVYHYLHGNHRRGERMVIGYLRSQSISISREQVRLSIDRVDPDGKELRKLKRIQRRVYDVEGPMHLWHLDGHHKLIKYGFVTMAAIDGNTRTCIYINTVTNNRAATALSLFIAGCREYDIPSRVRGDKGGENVLIADYMIEQRGQGRGSYIAGPSKFNTRIERLWGIVHNHTTKYYKYLFESLERDGMDCSNAVHMYTLQHMFLGRINEDHEQFRQGWNKHPNSGERNFSPHALMLLRRDAHPAPLAVHNDYGADDALDGENSDGEDENDPPPVYVDPVLCPLNDIQLGEFRARCPPLTLLDSHDTLVDKYMTALEIMMEIING